jgi:signal transduction histidine kinase
VRDYGVGIKKKQLKKIFDRFYRAEESREKEAGGHGLGLAIAKIIVLGHRGKIKVKSVYGEGSVFTILLPYIKLLEDSTIQTIEAPQGGTE